MKPIGKLYLAALAIAFLGLSPMFATPGPAAEKDPCAEDVSKFCQDFPPGIAAIANCLEYHEKDLSPACREYRSKMTGRRLEIREEMMARVRFYQACKNDMAKFCKDVKSDLPEIVKCLSDHERELTGPCAEEIRGRRNAAKETKENKMGK
jgi:Cysteine rich repeat